jgi:hypothetical protein
MMGDTGCSSLILNVVPEPDTAGIDLSPLTDRSARGRHP